jgi:hypothetical protein
MSVETIKLLDDLLWFKHSDRGGAPSGLCTNAYALVSDSGTLLVDTMFEFLLPAVEKLTERGHPPVGLVLTHRHVAVNGDIFPRFVDTYDVPLLLHPADAADEHVKASGFVFADPHASDLPALFGLEALDFPGQTEGSIALYRERDGLFLAGDAAMGTTTPQAQDGLRRLVRPPLRTSVDDGQLRAGWLTFDRPLRHVGPLHGTPQFDQPDLTVLMEPLTREAPTADMYGDPIDFATNPS